jgi:xanthine/CO dehydrogenase XdhC/CoxF family maturation factor
MQELLETLASWTAEAQGVGRAVVVRTFGSAPRPEGAVLLRADDGRIAGSVSGGCVEGAVLEEAMRVLKTGQPVLLQYGITADMLTDVGLSCGGAISVFVEPLDW